MNGKRRVGRPPRYESKEQIEGLIEDYFKWCDGEILMDGEGKPILDKKGNPIRCNTHPPTVTGLALALGFISRQGLLEYQAKKEFSDTITRAKSRIERYTEERLFDRDGVNGAKFSLKNNFRGWSETPEQEREEPEKNDDGLLKALSGSAAEDWKDESEEEDGGEVPV